MIPIEVWTERVAAAARALPADPLESRWFAVSQRAIDLYEESVEDRDPAHLDRQWALANMPYGGTIAPGLWTGALLVAMLHDAGLPDRIEPILGTGFGLNYGFDRLRFIHPVVEGARLRGRFQGFRLTVYKQAGALLRLTATVAIEGVAKPALHGEWLLLYPAPSERSGE